MNSLSPKETRLIKVFLNEFKKMVQERNNVPFHPKSLTIVSQPYVEDASRFDFISYNKWFDELDIQTTAGTCNNILQTYLEVPITMLIDAEEAGKSLMSDKDSKKLMKALKLIRSIRLERQK